MYREREQAKARWEQELSTLREMYDKRVRDAEARAEGYLIVLYMYIIYCMCCRLGAMSHIYRVLRVLICCCLYLHYFSARRSFRRVSETKWTVCASR